MSKQTNFHKSVRQVSAITSLATLTFTLPLAAAAAAAAAGGTENLEEVVVTGYRASLNAALATKKEANGVVDQVVAEDIAKFPDQNLAESLQRVPGVTINQDAGEGRQITVRGLGPSYSRTRINGMESIATLGVTDADGGTNRTRSFDFNVFGSEIFQSLTVRKTGSADVDEGSLGATVDLNTHHPFDFKGFTFATSAQASYNDQSHSTSPRIAMLLSDRFADDKLGVLVSAAYSKRNVIEVGASTVRWQSALTNDAPPVAPATSSVLARNTFFSSTVPGLTKEQLGAAFRPRIPRYDYYENSQKRLGITASLQFKPSDFTDLSFDMLYSKYDAARNETFLETPAFSTSATTPSGTAFGAIDNMTVTNAAIDSTNSLIYGVFNNVGIRTEYRHDDMSTKFKQATLDLKQQLSGALTLHAFAGYSTSSFDNPVQTTLILDSNKATNGYTYDFRGSGVPYINSGSLNVTDPSNWKLTQIRLRPNGVDNKFTTGVIDLKWALSDQLTWLNGVQYKKFDFSTFERRRSNGSVNNVETTIPTSVAAIPVASYSQIVDSPLNAPAGSQLSWLAPNLETANQLMSLYDPAVFQMGIEPIVANNYVVQEKDSSVFTQLNFRFPLASMTLRGDIGLRYVKTKQFASGFSSTSGTSTVPTPKSVDNSYSDVLPALNSVLEVNDNMLVRFSAAKVMARAGLGSLNPGAVVSVSGTSFTVSAGDSSIKPNRATTFDLGFEWYPVKGMLLGMTMFYKKIDTFVQTARSVGPFSANPFGLPSSLETAACGTTTGCIGSTNWQFSQPANTPGGPVKGVETNLQIPFASFLPSAFEHLGVLLNYTYIDSKIDYIAFVNGVNTVVATDSLTELSRHAANGTLYFDNGKFSARVTATYRSDYLQTIPGRNGIVYAGGANQGATVPLGNDVEGTKGSTIIDFSTSWNITEQLSVSFEGQNLTNRPNFQYMDSDAKRLSFYHLFGRQFMLGGRFKF